jgi:phage internal scaffolding protein
MSLKFRTLADKIDRVSYFDDSPSMTKQSFKEQCDINKIVGRFIKTGTLTHFREKAGSYGDFTQVKDFQSAMQSVLAAEDAFELLPSELRKRFNQNPSEMISFLDNPANMDEAIALGLVSKPVLEQNVVSESSTPTPVISA